MPLIVSTMAMIDVSLPAPAEEHPEDQRHCDAATRQRDTPR
jgi:hypothetical protein